MKKVILFFACVCALIANANADNYQPITRDQLPKKAQAFLTSYFADTKTSLVRKEIDVMGVSYDVIFADGSKVEFDRKGDWTDVDCGVNPLPAGIVPKAIENVIRTQYPGAKAIKIERDRNEYDVKLSNRVELTFNKKMQLVDID